MEQRSISIFDSTLRDGAQGQGISFSLQDKIKIVKVLDDMGITYIEAGNPGSNPKDMEFFKQIKKEVPRPASVLPNSKINELSFENPKFYLNLCGCSFRCQQEFSL